jgi:hypothetical protein
MSARIFNVLPRRPFQFAILRAQENRAQKKSRGAGTTLTRSRFYLREGGDAPPT